MKFKLDENLPEDGVKVLANAGHDTSTALEEQLGGKHDSEIAHVCKIEQRALITLDTGFGDIRRYPPGEYPGIVVLRLTRQDKPNVLAVLERLLPKFSREPLAGHLWVVEEHRIRLRPG